MVTKPDVLNRLYIDGDERDYIDWRLASGGTVEIFDIEVGSERRRGRGRLLIETLFRKLAHVPCVWAITRADNFIAQLFYERLGFEPHPLRRFYNPGCHTVDAILYCRSPRGPV